MNERCPHTDPFLIQGQPFTAEEIIEILGPLLYPERRRRIDEIVENRTYTIVPVLEGLYDRGNISAVLRSAEALGYQAAHVIELSEAFKEAKRVTQGAEKWLDIQLWQATPPCVEKLKALGHRVLTTRMGNATPIEEIDFTQPTALFFGNEKDGVTDQLQALADEAVIVPMPGFTRSYNISVAAALCLYHIYRDRRRRLGSHGDLTPSEQRRLTASYYCRSFDETPAILLGARKSRNTSKAP